MTENEICYSRLRLSDLDEIMAVEQRCYPFPWSRDIMENCLQQSGYYHIAIKQNNRIIGYIFMSYGAEEAHVLNLCVLPDYRGKRYGMSLLQYAIDDIRQYNVKNIYLEVRSSNVVAIALYFDMGFNEIGIRKGYYPAKVGREDAIVMAKTLF